ncbi:MAG: Gfo/Idh/MocA family oxidoreductase [Armatimonadetes bacterium]|nr:Gfo/Idh/MocA family oxidoreductase [Armatimonadota bacterium]
MSKLGIGFIGCGGIHHAHAPHLVGRDDARIVCAMDVNEAAAKAHCEKYATPHWTTSRTELLARDDVDAGVICTPTGFHKEAVLEAAAAGKQIFCEKPMAMSVADCEAMDAACRAAGVVLQIGFVRHFCNEWLKLREIIQEGMIGRPVQWRSVSGGSGAPTPWFFDKELGGGPFIDGAVHSYDWARFIFGEAANVVTDIRKLKSGTTAWDTGTVIVNFASGDQQVLMWSWGLPGFGYGVPADDAHDVLGPLGSIMFPGGNQLKVNLEDGEHLVEFEADTGNDWFRKQMDSFLECCRTGEAPIAGAHEGIEATRIAAAALSVGDRPAIIEL